MSLATAANWGFNLLVAATFLTIVQKLGKTGAFWLYAGLTVLAAIFCWLFIPETKGHTLENIEQHLKSGKSLKKLGA